MKSRFFAAIASVAALALAGGGSAQGDTITFGAPLCLTGDQAPLDTPGYRGAQVAIKALNDRGGLLGSRWRWSRSTARPTRSRSATLLSN